MSTSKEITFRVSRTVTYSVPVEIPVDLLARYENREPEATEELLRLIDIKLDPRVHWLDEETIEDSSIDIDD